MSNDIIIGAPDVYMNGNNILEIGTNYYNAEQQFNNIAVDTTTLNTLKLDKSSATATYLFNKSNLLNSPLILKTTYTVDALQIGTDYITLRMYSSGIGHFYINTESPYSRCGLDIQAQDSDGTSRLVLVGKGIGCYSPLNMSNYGINISSDISGVKAIRWSDGSVSTSAYSSGGGIGDNLGNHIATTTLDMAGNLITNVSTITAASGLSGIIITTTTFISGQLRHTYGIVSDGVGYGTSVGNPRGEGANDLQVYRAANTHVASGDYSVISGGKSNRASGAYSTVSGGNTNAATAIGATISGGSVNTANNSYTTVSGGTENTASGWVATVSGGNRNIASGDYATIGGGKDNTAKGNYSWAAGYLSSSTAHGTFTWSDSEGEPVNNNVIDQVRFKARGGFWVSTSTVYNSVGLFVSSTNNVGIGTTNPGYKLTIGGSGSIFGIDNATAFAAKNSAGTYENYLWPRWSDNITYLNYGSGGFNIRNNSSVSTMFMTNGGNVGIGTTAPNSKLEIVREIAHSYPTPGQTYGSLTITPQGTNDNSASITFRANAGGVLATGAQAGIYVQSSGCYGTKMYFATTNSYGTGAQSRMMIDHAGNVGIGTSDPQTKLAVSDLGSSASGSYLRYLTDGTGRIYYDSSSLRYKEDIQPLVDDFTKILKIEPKSFIDKATGNREIGYIAEELDTLGLKNLVGYNQDGLPDTLHYEKIVIYLLEVVKSQQEDIRILKEKLNKE